jgi:hypothetical protein
MRPGFSGRFLLPTARPWSEVLRFFEEDRSPDCVAGGCRFAEPDPSSRNGDPVGLAPLVARIDETAGKGTSRSVVYYLQRGSAGNKIFRATNALANLDDPAFRAWRVAEARRMLERGGYDAVMLNHKLHQYRSEGHWLGGPAAPDVTALNRLGDTLWTAPPSGYGYPEYVAGWHALASDLRAGGVPYGVILSVAPWRRRTLPGSDSASDENALIREVARGARVVLLDGRVGKRGALFVAVQRELEAAGARVVPIDSSCGLPGSRLGSPRASE